jgi:hypothetical protein
MIHSVYKLCMVAPTCFGIILPFSGSVPSAFGEIEEQSIEYCGWVHHVTRHNTPIHNILTTTQLSISQKALGTLPENGNIMPKHVGATIHNL